MKKVGVIFVLLLVFTGCSQGSSELQQGMALRSKLSLASSITFDADITADYGQTVHNFSMACQSDSLGNLTFTVTAPETISGITGTVSQEGGKLTFEDTALQFDTLAEDQVTPVTAPWILVKTLLSGYLTSACTEEDAVRLSIDDRYEEDALHLDIWLNEESLPSRADIFYDDRRILSLTVKNFTVV